MSVYRRIFLVAAAVLAPAAFAADPKPDIENGKTTFAAQCGICHQVVKEGPSMLAPNMFGIVGRKAASDPNYAAYSAAMKNSKLTWNTKTLDEFIANPIVSMPGTSMPMLIPDAKLRADVIAYMATLK